jgi:hypothetical protein
MYEVPIYDYNQTPPVIQDRNLIRARDRGRALSNPVNLIFEPIWSSLFADVEVYICYIEFLRPGKNVRIKLAGSLVLRPPKPFSKIWK